MKAIVLAGGRGNRMNPITQKIPKPLIEINGKSLLHRVIDNIPGEIAEVLIVVKYLDYVIKEKLGNSYGNKNISYIQQGDMNGTLGALYSCKDYIEKDCNSLIISADNIYSLEDIKTLSKMPKSVLMYKNTLIDLFNNPLKNYSNTILVNIDSQIKDIDLYKYINTGAYNIPYSIFNVEPKIEISSGEYSIPHTILSLIKEERYSFLYTNYWYPVGNHFELDYANAIFQKLNQ